MRVEKRPTVLPAEALAKAGQLSTVNCFTRRSFSEGGPTANCYLMKYYFDKIPSWLKNKYVITALCFGVWILFIDDRDFVTTHFRHLKELHKLEARKVYFEDQITTVRKELDQLKSNPGTLEKYAREKYLMKRDNEDLFVIK
jgi:cell division protein DivIC